MDKLEAKKVVNKKDLKFDRKVRINIFKQFRKPYNVWYAFASTLLLIFWTALVISHIIKGYNWLPLTLVYLGLIPFALSTHRQLDE